MAEVDADYLSIGEVLGLLVEEFPEVTISKIRFLESQGLINPERTTSGYRKFHELDVELLRVILTEQRENYLPLRVIKDRIDTGEIDPSSEISHPRASSDRTRRRKLLTQRVIRRRDETSNWPDIRCSVNRRRHRLWYRAAP